MTYHITYRVEDKKGLFHVDVPTTYSIAQLLQRVKTNHSKDYQYVVNFNESTIMDQDDDIAIYCTDPSFVFYFSTSYEIPDKSEFNDTEEPPIAAPAPFAYPEINIDFDGSEYTNDILQTANGNAIQYQLQARDELPALSDNEFYIFSTKSYDAMINPVKITIPQAAQYEAVEQKIRAKLSVPEANQILIYLPNGCPFIPKIGKSKTPNTLGLYFTSNPTSQHNLYVVISRKIEKETVDMEIDQICDVSNDEMKLLYSPLSKARDAEYSRIACLVGTFAYNGHQTGRLINSLARITGFAPLISSIASLQNHVSITGRQLVAITASFHALCSFLVPVPEDDIRLVFQNVLECACYLVRIDETCVKKRLVRVDNQLQLPELEISGTSTDPAVKYLFDSYMRGHFYQYGPNLRRGFCYQVLTQRPPPHLIEYIFRGFASYRPIPPLSTRQVNMTSIVQSAKRHTLLFLGESNFKRVDASYANIIDPLNGQIQRTKIEQLADQISKFAPDDIASIIDPNEVEELVIILLDISGSMRSVLQSVRIANQCKHDKTQDPPKPLLGETSRFMYAYQYILSFAQRTFGFRYPHLMSLLTFNKKVNQICNFTPIPTPIEKLPEITLQDDTLIWQAIDKALHQFDIANPEHKVYKNAQHRILVFSDGIDEQSPKTDALTQRDTICEKAITSNVIVDSVVLTTFEGVECESLAKFCHLTGGYSFRPYNAYQGLDLFEMESFLATRLRPEPDIATPPITREVFEAASGDFDTTIPNEDYTSKTLHDDISTPNYVMSKKKAQKNPLESYELRILREIKKFQAQADPDLYKLYIKTSDINQWHVYIFGPEDTPFANRWWSLSLQFSELYPLVPPLCRFIDVPYHINISEDGRVCASFLFDGYSSNTSILDIIYKIRELLANPENETPISATKLLQSHYENDQYIARQIASAEDVPTSADHFIRLVKIHDDTHFVVSPNDFEEGAEDDDLPSNAEIDNIDILIMDPFSPLFIEPDDDDFK